jgi:hypothetical protein
MATPIAQLLALVQNLSAKDVSYSVDGAVVTAPVAGDPFVVAELDEKATTFRFVPQKSSGTASRMPSFEAGGIYNAAKRGGLIGHKPSQLRVKGVLAELFTSNGWTRAR